jgi:acetyl esterase/lipase
MTIGGAAALATPLSAMASAAQAPAAVQTPDASGVKVEKDVVTGKGGDVDIKCDIYRPPAGTEKRMAIVHFHGGGWRGGSKDTLAAKVTPITARGYVSIAAQYRLTGAAPWPAQIEDVKTQVRWAHDNADRLGVDPKRIAVAGYSAGGHLALIAAGTPELPIAACIAFYAAADVGDDALRTMLLPPGADDAAVHAANAMSYLHAGFPPTILFHGLADTAVKPESSLHVLQSLRDDNVACELHTFAGVPHEFDMHPEFAEACAALTDFFLDREIINPKTYPAFGPGGGRGRGPGAGAPGRG